MIDPEKEKPGIRLPIVGNGTFDGGWQPGAEDPNQQAVGDLSDPLRPGIVPSQNLVDMGGVLLTPDQLARLRKLSPSARLGTSI